jgi:tryptophan 2,3-dioxygenase
MTESTMIALFMLGGVFSLMVVTVVKAGHEAAIKMWGVMGALTGVAFGSMTSYYFTREKFQSELAAADGREAELVVALNNAALRAGEVEKNISRFTSALEGNEVPNAGAAIQVAYRIGTTIPESDKNELISKLQVELGKLGEIKKVANEKEARQ